MSWCSVRLPAWSASVGLRWSRIHLPVSARCCLEGRCLLDTTRANPGRSFDYVLQQQSDSTQDDIVFYNNWGLKYHYSIDRKVPFRGFRGVQTRENPTPAKESKPDHAYSFLVAMWVSIDIGKETEDGSLTAAEWPNQ